MPLDFPTSPTNGQAYNGYVYSTAVGAWQAKPSAQSPFYTGDTPPGNPVVGDSWFNTNDGTMYVYYNDGNTSQWVEHRSEIARSQVGLVPIMPTSVTINAGTASVNTSGEVSFTGGSVLTLNGVFSSAFRSYKIIWEIESSSAGADIYFQLKNSGGTLSSGYGNYQVQGNTSSQVSAFFITQNIGNIGRTNGSGGSFLSMDIVNPGNTKVKHWTCQTVDTLLMRISNGYNTTATAYTDLIIYPNGQNSTLGTMKVYGYN